MKQKLLLAAALSMAVSGASAQITLVQRGTPKSRIVVNHETAVDGKAAALLQKFVDRISGATLPIVKNETPQKGDIVIGEGEVSGLIEDGFRLSQKNGALYISSGGDKGTLYGVVQLLEDYLGVRYYSTNYYTLKEKSTVKIPKIDRVVNPAFTYRQSQCYALSEDTDYRAWMRLEEHPDLFVDSYWVHTFSRLIPASQYGKSHPEYYAEIDGVRRPGDGAQLCLTNPQLFEVMAKRVDDIFKAHPERDMISISQNDGEDTYCTCAECKKVTDREGSQSGLYLQFVNRLAERFPDKKFSTLAYYFTQKPPKYTRPAANVNVMLCDIEATRETPLDANVKGREFMEDFRGWSAICDNIFLWDYGINFSAYVAPFPNFPVLGPNMKIFKDNSVKMHFSQIGGIKGGDFSEMRAYIVSKLMWNPNLNVDATMKEFMKGYYGAAWKHIYKYEKRLEKTLKESGKPLLIYDTPVSHKDGMLSADNRRYYNSLFDKAERAVRNDSALLAHVQMSRLPLQYAELEIERVGDIADPAALRAKVKDFEEKTARYGVKILNEGANKPQDYASLYLTRYLSSDTPNKARGAKITYNVTPSDQYAKMPSSTLADGKFGGGSYKEGWIGWVGRDAEFIVDLGKETDFSTIQTECMQHNGAWVLLPKKIQYSVSSDGKTYTDFGMREMAEDKSSPVRFVKLAVSKDSPVKARYIKVSVTGTKICPSWHGGAGKPCWMFIDEVEVF